MPQQINVTRSSMPPFEEYVEEIRPLWESRWLTNMGEKHCQLEQQLAEKLGVPCYDKLLIKKTAAESGLSEDFIRQEEETPAQSRWFLSGNAFADSAALSEAFYSGSQMIYDAEQKVIRQLAEKGPCVIVGRCASELLKGSNVLSVFIYADEPDCVARVM